jgi:hypothetical protein
MKKIVIFGCMFLMILFSLYGSGNKEDEYKQQEHEQKEERENEMIMKDNESETPTYTRLEKWAEILGLGVTINAYIHLRQEVLVEGMWEEVHGLGWNSLPGKRVFILHFSLPGGQPLVSYMLVPYQHLFKSEAGVSSAIIHADSFYTVTRHALVFGPLYRKNHARDDNRASRVEELVAWTTKKKANNTIVPGKQEIPVPPSLQLISLELYPHYVLMDAAIPGSVIPGDKELITLSGNRMIRLSLIPDAGPVRQRWIAPPPETGEFPGEGELQGILSRELEALCKGIRENSIDPVPEEPRLHIFHRIMEKGDREEYRDLIRRLLALDESSVESSEFTPDGSDTGEYDPENLFPDYEPKTTPDVILDYRPGLQEVFSQYPGPFLDNLADLVSLHHETAIKAKENPGEWHEGTIILGGAEKEYIPSDEELVVCEIDRRILIILTDTPGETLQHYYKAHNLWGTELEIMTIEIWHADVMGSGRFFYADLPEKTIRHLE